MKFSDRIGITQVKNTIQLNSMDTDLRNGLWNCLKIGFINKMDSTTYDYVRLSPLRGFINGLWFSYYKEPIDNIPSQISKVKEFIKQRFFQYEWYEVYNFIEFVIENTSESISAGLIDSINMILKRELSGYRLVSNEFTPITDEEQMSEIQKAIDNSESSSELKGVNIHLKAALHKLSDKANPDYRNSIKESISAIESLSQTISGDKKAELGKALKLIKDKVGLHSALEQGFIKIYGYTSDGDGIRHSLSEESTLDLEDAIYMLISCSAFINYLITKANKAGIVL
jgi:hypothetical protein